ncbi:MAG: tetratricopeptide repeat protein [Stellaceae bacterium]
MVSVALCVGLSACDNTTRYFDPLTVDGRDGSAHVTYPILMRIGEAARAGHDYSNAVALFRRAAVIAPREAVPLVAAGDTLRDMGNANEAIVAYNAALKRKSGYGLALEGLAKAYLMTGKPELAQSPLAVAAESESHNPKILLLQGVAADYSGQHRQAQAFYRAGLKLAPKDAALSLDLSLSLALTGQYDEAIEILYPIANAPVATARDRQTLALIYGLKGDIASAARLARMDLNPAAVQHNLAYYETLRRLSPAARAQAVLSASGGPQTLGRS